MKERSFTCIVCPAGCRLKASFDEASKAWLVEGNKCDRGRQYAVSEMSDPKRTVTAVVRTDSEALPWAPVRSSAPLRRPLVLPLLKAIYSMEAKAPFKTGDVLIKDYGSSGVDVIFTRDSE